MSKCSKWISRSFMLGFFMILLSIVYAGTSYALEQEGVSPTAQENNAQPPAIIYGKITDREGYSVPHAKVDYELYYRGDTTKHSLLADENGNYRFEAVVEDYTDLKLYVEAEGFIAYASYKRYESYTLSPGDDLNINVSLYEPSTIVGTVTDSAGQPVTGAAIKVTSITDRLIQTDANGRYTVTGIDYDYNPNIAIWIDSQDHLPYLQDRLGIDAGQTLRIDVVLEDAAHVQGRIVDSNGNPIAGAKVSGYTQRVTTDDQGNYILKRLQTGSTTIVVEASGYPKHNIRADLTAGDNTVDFVLRVNQDVQPPVTKYRLVPLTETINGKLYIVGFTFRLQATDEANGSGVKITQYRYNGGEWMTYNGPVKFYANDVKLVEYYSTDVAGNAEKMNKMDFVNGIFEGAGSY
ncbi:carboxypeptidase-like regulatory domain-containing protein [Paenibacillus tundrae]|uniref:Protocatechuate 3,4-dioxygenase beta subunit n=1 Tax=Paenibacillus tundrae TaxID=528187 RepID=A0ABT9W9G9_9BACL|nr:carboxypeptidase-like regulatory domain-containing protein [Paenibacillus tundrae]MDQ0169912.1 protocatechuate 3,4-dioxygenase beta subunit [Paenibacillus tundrae]